MTKIKIISNPYEKNISYEKYDDKVQCWKQITYDSSRNSPLVSNELTKKNFPHKAKKIVDSIIKSYRTGNSKVEIIFEGSKDEFKELESICSMSDKVSLSLSDRYLENAKDVLKKIKYEFHQLDNCFADKSISEEKIKNQLEKFSDASSDVIPICIMGNYSCGKSAFINALIGREILPSAAAPYTAKVFKIKNSETLDSAEIKLKYDENDILVSFNSLNYTINQANDNPLVNELNKIDSNAPEKSLEGYVYEALKIINGFEKDVETKKLSDLVEVTFPFSENSQLVKSGYKFVIFYTPGPNSASNKEHLCVLKNALEDLSNGLPIYVSKYDALDSEDNEKTISEQILGLEELDSRYTMIIINQADSTLRYDRDENAVLNQVVPKKLYSAGIYYVSSIFGLGAKKMEYSKNVKYFDENATATYMDLFPRFSDESHPFYKQSQLYRFNIMPEQSKLRVVGISEKCSNRVLANSGLLAVENEIITFAEKYSQYNKCHQARLFLEKAINLANSEILNTKKELEESEEQIEEELESNKQKLKELIIEKSSAQQDICLGGYPMYMSGFENLEGIGLSKEQIIEIEQQIKKALIGGQNVDETIEAKNEEITRVQEKISSGSDEIKQSFGQIGNGFANIFKQKNAKDFFSHLGENTKDLGLRIAKEGKNIFIETGGIVSGSVDKLKKQFELNNDINTKTKLSVITMTEEQFKKDVNILKQNLSEGSVKYLDEQSSIFREEICKVATNSDALDESQKKIIQDVIMEYGEIKYTPANETFAMNEVQHYLIRIFGKNLIETNRVDPKKLSKKYLEELQDTVHKINGNIINEHKNNFKSWRAELTSVINSNITQFNESLKKQANMIEEGEKEIARLQSLIERFKTSQNNISSFMNWKESN